MQWIKRITAPVLCAVVVLVVAGSAAQTASVAPTVDLSIGPVAVNAQAVNIALALSVEFPTVGSAYRRADYDHATTYLGYFDPKGCYDYKDSAVGAPLSGEYFYRTGNTDSSSYCNTSGSGTGYSGNALNYVTTSSIDLLRYALTGGDRVVDTATTTVLGRAYLRDSWQLHDGTYFPAKRIPATYVGKVTPNHGNIDVYGGGCWDRVWFGTSNASKACDNPGTSGNLNKSVPDPTSTTTVAVTSGAPAPTGGTFITTTFSVTSPLQTTTVEPTEGPITFNDVTVLGAGTGTVVPPGFTTATTFLYTQYTLDGTTSTIAPVSPEPTVLAGTTTTTFSTRYFFGSPPLLGAYRAFSLTTSTNVCRTSASTTPIGLKGLLTGAGAPTNVSSGSCGTGAFLGFPSRGNVSTPRTVFEPYDTVNVYARHTATPVYRGFAIQRNYHVYNKQDVYTVFGTKIGVMYARVRVCDDTEKTSRTDLCKRYPDGNYKPVGEIQRYSEGVRVAAFGYLKDDTTTRYGGVLRAPMKYPGPTYRDPSGVLQTNTQSQWNVNNGVFTTDPLGAAPTHALSGAVNYLNKFGTTGTTKGYYKGFDPVGELYYEVLRYYQGLSPTTTATASLTASPALADGFPVYLPTSTGERWEDPLQNACERRNFILAIGDVNTHRDRQLPGHNGSVGSDAVADPARGTEVIPGPDTSKVFNATYWTDLLTGFETNVSKSYTDSLGRGQSTLGNPNPNTNNTNLASKGTGSGSTSAYYWAGAAYWANTQPIRLDSKGGQSMKDVRVKTFTIDVDEGGNGDIEDTNVRGIKPRRSSFYLAGKYGWFDDANSDGNPFRTNGISGSSNQEWEDDGAPNTPDGYVIASQAQKLIDGIRKFFAAASSQKGAVSVSALSSQRFTSNAPNGDLFAPRFDTRDWSGTVERTQLVLNTSTAQLEAKVGIIWDAGQILTAASSSASPTVSDPYVKPVDRRIFTMTRDSGTMAGIAFTTSTLGSLDLAVRTALATNPATGIADSLAEQRVKWLRGYRDDEQSSTGGALRRRPYGIMGDVINSGPVYKKEADPDVQGAGYLSFVSSVVNRTGVIYVGANDGMLHAFRAGDGKELFAYMPRAVAPDVNKLTNPNYVHRPYVDGVPATGEVQVGSTWKTVLVSGMGGGAQGVFAIDVTDPTNFGASNAMFEFTDADDPDMGNVLAQPKLVKIKVPGATTGSPPTYKWFVAVSSGYNNYKVDGSFSATGNQALFFLSVDKPGSTPWQLNTNYFKVVLPNSVATATNGLSNPGVVLGKLGEASVMYAGDLHGNVWKFDLEDGLNATTVSSLVFGSPSAMRPIFTATDSAGNRQPITTSPVPVVANARGYMVTLGTGKFVEPSDTTTSGTQTIYGIWDTLETTATAFTVPRNKLFQRTATEGASTIVVGTSTFAYGFDTGQYRGWYLDLPSPRERIAVEGVTDFGYVAFNSAIPDGSCSGDGNGRNYVLNPVTGIPTSPIASGNNIGLLSRSNPVTVEDVTGAYSARDARGFRRVTVNRSLVTTGTRITEGGSVGVTTTTIPPVELPGGRISWRELRN